MSTVAVDELPLWEIESIYPGFDSRQYQDEFARLAAELADLERYFDAHSIRRLAGDPLPPDGELAAIMLEVLRRTNSVLLLEDTLGSYAHARLTTDSYDPAALRETSKIEIQSTHRQKLEVRLKGWLGSLESRLPELIRKKPELERYAFFLTDSARQSRYLMTEPLEDLAAELCLDAGTAFGKLQGSVTSQLKVPLERDGELQQLPITVVRNLCFDPDPEVRERAHRAELAGWHSIRTTVAACLNGVKGTALTLAKRRGRESVLDAALDNNRIDRPTLDALLGAIREAFPMFRRYFRSKAHKLGKPRLPWWDLFAPVGSAHQTYSWPQARDFIVDRFSIFSGELGEYAARAFDQRWIDARPREGKRGGAYCMVVMSREESRILANFDGSLEQVLTLAHELGHGFHNHCQAGLEPLRRGSPSTLAETASIFCETLVAEAAIREGTPDEQLTILEAQVAGATQVCLDISSRFLFESALLERRAQSELSPDEICELMLDAQKQTYGDGLDEATYHRYMWLWKPHYYSHDHNFYNFPYAFGHLFGLGLYAVYGREGDAFIGRYSELLRSTGQDYAAPLAKRFGIDLTQRDFWRASLKVIEGQVRRYESLPGGTAPE